MKNAVLFVILLLCCNACMADLSQQEEAEQLGYRILAVQHALDNPSAPTAMTSIMELGTDSRYYSLTRGWLLEQLRGDLSIRDASSAQRTPELILQRIELLETAIRAIDLE